MSLNSELAASLLKMFPHVALGKVLLTPGIKDNLARKYFISRNSCTLSPCSTIFLRRSTANVGEEGEGLEDPPRRIEPSALFKLIGRDNSFRMHIVNGDE